MRFSAAFLDELRSRVPVSEVVCRKVRLKKQGREWRGLSPFNKERTPSFFVNDQKRFYHDFSSGKHGDIFTFLMETEGLTFPEAVEKIADLAGTPRNPEHKLADDAIPPQEEEPLPTNEDRAKLARYLWSISRPLAGSPAASYLTARACFVPSPCIRYLPGRGEHIHAMIARFGSPDMAVSGVHLTKLNTDGTGKAGTENDKIMIGPSMGQPIMVHDKIEGAELILAEGIEDAASLALATGWAACAAGSAGRLSRVLINVSRMARVYLAVDADRAGRVALEQCLAVRPDLIPVRVSKCFAPSVGMDANKAIRLHGSDMLLAAIEWCEAQTRYSRGDIGFHAMQAAMARMDGLAKASLPPAI